MWRLGSTITHTRAQFGYTFTYLHICILYYNRTSSHCIPVSRPAFSPIHSWCLKTVYNIIYLNVESRKRFVYYRVRQYNNNNVSRYIILYYISDICVYIWFVKNHTVCLADVERVVAGRWRVRGKKNRTALFRNVVL